MAECDAESENLGACRPQGWIVSRLPFFYGWVMLPIVIVIQVSSIWTSHVFAVILGGGQGVMMAVRATLWVRYYGRPHLGKIRGSLVTIEVAASSTGPFLMGAAHDVFGGYHEVLWLFAAISAPMIGFGLLATQPKRRPERAAA